MAPAPTKNGILLESGTNEVEFLLVALGTQKYGINVSKVCQIMVYDPQTLSELPSSYPEVLGIMVFRSETISVVDLAIHLKRKEERPSQRLLIVTEFNERRTGFVVDSVDRIERVNWTAFEPLQGTGNGAAVASILGTVRRNEGLVLILDLETILGLLDPSMNIETHAKDIKSATIDRAKVRILHCEDSGMIQKLVHKVLSDGGFRQIQQVSNGQAALDLLKSGGSQFDIVISDIEMPVMDGLTFCRTMRQDSQFDKVPVLFFSSMITDQMLAKCRTVGGDAAFSKPQIGQIISAVEDFATSGRGVSKDTPGYIG